MSANCPTLTSESMRISSEPMVPKVQPDFRPIFAMRTVFLDTLKIDHLLQKIWSVIVVRAFAEVLISRRLIVAEHSTLI